MGNTWEPSRTLEVADVAKGKTKGCEPEEALMNVIACPLIREGQATY